MAKKNNDPIDTLPAGTTFFPSLTPQQAQAALEFSKSPTAQSVNKSGGKLGGYAGYDGPSGGANSTAGKKATPAAATTPAAAPAPSYDPLALQQMWANVFGPVFAQAANIAGNAGPDYLSAMTNAIQGSHQSQQVEGQQLSQAKAMSDLLQTFAGNQLQQVATGPAYDQLISWLQQATGAAQQAQGAAEKGIAYGTNLNAAAAFGVPSATAATSANNLSPQQAAALTQQALSGTQTGPTATTGGAAATNPLLPQTLLQSQGLP